MMHFRFFMKDVVKDSRAHHLGSWRSWKYTSKETEETVQNGFFFICLFFESPWGTSGHFKYFQQARSPFLSKSFRWDAKLWNLRFFVASFPNQNAPTNYLRRFDLWKTGFFLYFEWKSDHRSTGASKKSKGFTIHFGTSLGCGFERWRVVFLWLKLCVTSRVRQHSGLANRYHARDSWSMQMQELKQLYSPATKDTEKRKIWHYDFLRFHQKKSRTNVQKICDVFSLESCGFTKVHDNLQSSVPWWFFKYRSWNNLGNI